MMKPAIVRFCIRLPFLLTHITSLDEAFFTYTKPLSPAAVDVELHSLLTLPAFRRFLHCLSQRLRSRRDFEAVQTYLNVFLRMHGDELIELRADLEKLLELQKQETNHVLD